MAGVGAGRRRGAQSRAVDRLKDLAAETGAQTLVTGAYYKNGPTIRLQAQVTDVNNGTVLAALAGDRSAVAIRFARAFNSCATG